MQSRIYFLGFGVVAAIFVSDHFGQASLATAKEAYSQFNYLDAVKECKESNEPACILLTADSYFFYAVQNKKTPEEEIYYQKCDEVLSLALDSNPQWGSAWARKGRILGAIALFKGTKEKVKLGHKIREAADKALELAPTDPVSYAVSAIWHWELSNLNFFERTFGGVLFGKIPKGNLNTAEQHMRKAVELDPRSVFYRIRLAELLDELDHEEEALRIRKEASLLQPSESFEIKDIASLKDALQ